MMSELYGLPEGWEWKKISEIFKIRSGKFLPKKNMVEDGKYNVYGGNGINGKHNEYNLSDDNIIIGRVGALCGNVRYVNDSIWLTDNAFYISDYKTEISKIYLAKFLAFIDLGKTANQAAQPVISYKSISVLDIPLPPLQEQKRIVAKLDRLFEKIDKAIALHQKNMDEADVFMGSVLNEVFGELEADKVTLKVITSKIGSGSTPRGGQKSYKTEGISLIRSMNVHDAGFRTKGLAFIDDEQAKKLNNVTIEENDVLLNITGASVARCCIVDKAYLPARVNQHVSIIRLKEDILPKFLHYYLISPSVKADLLFSSSGGATREAITKSMLENFEVPLLAIESQQKTVQYLDQLSQKTVTLKQVQQEKMQSLKDLKASILDRAFRGEL